MTGDVFAYRGAATAAYADAPVPRGMIRVGTLRVALPVLRECGVDPAMVLADFGLNEAWLQDADNQVPYVVMGLFLRRCSELTGRPHFGLLVGSRLNISSLGTVGFLVQSASDVRAGLLQLSRWFRFHNPNGSVYLSVEDGSARLGFALLMPQIEGRQAILDGAMCLAFNTMRKFCGSAWEAQQIRFSHGAPADPTPYRRFFAGASLRFDDEESCVVFDRRWLDEPLPTADPELHEAMLKRLQAMELQREEDVASQVRRMLPPLISARAASVDVVASLVGLSARSLARRLAVEGTTYMRLREEARYVVACQLLEGTALLANEISDRLGYTNPSAFSRAFQRWAGKTPAEWRLTRNVAGRKR
jgi:AraC-like DNA-binding protein